MKTKTKKLFYISMSFVLLALFFLAIRSTLGLGTATYGWLESVRSGSFAVATVVAEGVMALGVLFNIFVGFKIRLGAEAKKRDVDSFPLTWYMTLGVTTLMHLCYAPHVQAKLVGVHGWNAGLPAIGIAAAAGILSIVVVRLIPTRPEAE